VGKQSNRQMIIYLPLVVLATFLVAVCPSILVWSLRASGAVSSIWAAVGLGAALSFAASYVGGALWKTRTHSEDLLFGELMLWGWVQRWRIERRLTIATDLLGLTGEAPASVAAGGLTDEQRADLLTQLASTLEARDPYTHGHSRRVARHASSIAKRMGLSAEEVAKVRTAAAMHDVGKVKTPIAVLHKEGKLTDEEFEVIKRHPGEGASMVSMLRDDELTVMVRHHHERLDGTGYPDRLAGDGIPIGARIIAVADTFDAITSTRAYRSARAHKRALDILCAEAGTQLDPDAVRAFCSCYSGMRPLAIWTILISVPQRLVSWLGGGVGTANAASVANVMATAAATAAVGGVALGALVKPPVPTHSHPAVRTAAVDSVAPASGQRSRTPRSAWRAGGHAPSHRSAPATGRTASGAQAAATAPVRPPLVLRAPASVPSASPPAISARSAHRLQRQPPRPVASPRAPVATVTPVRERTGDPIRVSRSVGEDPGSRPGTGFAPAIGNGPGQQAPVPGADEHADQGRGHRRHHRHAHRRHHRHAHRHRR